MWEARRSLSSVGLTYDDRSLPGTESQPCTCLSTQDGKAVFRIGGWKAEVQFVSDPLSRGSQLMCGGVLKAVRTLVGFMFVSF